LFAIPQSSSKASYAVHAYFRFIANRVRGFSPAIRQGLPVLAAGRGSGDGRIVESLEYALHRCSADEDG
jgi:hypothetical protein